jgi:hypothetical protein
MAISFPSSPTTNQTYTYNGRTWQWTGTVWQSTGSVSTVSVTGPISNSGTLTNPILGLNTTLPAVTSVNGTTIPSSATLLTSTSTSINGSTVPASDTLVGRATTDTLTNKTLTSSILSGAALEGAYTTATGFAGYTFYATTNGAVQYITAASTANGTVNIASTSGQSLNTLMSNGQSMTIALLVTNTGTPYYPTAWQIDGTGVTPKWANGVAPSAGNANAIDVYQVTIIKTASATYTVLASQSKFA